MSRGRRGRWWIGAEVMEGRNDVAIARREVLHGRRKRLKTERQTDRELIEN